MITVHLAGTYPEACDHAGKLLRVLLLQGLEPRSLTSKAASFALYFCARGHVEHAGATSKVHLLLMCRTH